jgi:hypothetical protein
MFTTSISGFIPLDPKLHAYTDVAGTIKAQDGDKIAALKNGGINAVQATLALRPTYKANLGVDGNDIIWSDGIDDFLADAAFQFGSSYTVAFVIKHRKRSAFGQGLLQAGANYLYNGAYTFTNGNVYLGSPVMWPNYSCVNIFSVRNGVLASKIDDRAIWTSSTGAVNPETGLKFFTVGGGNYGAYDITQILIHPTVGINDAQMNTLFSELSSYYGGFPIPLAAGKIPLFCDGNSYSSAGAAFGTYNAPERPNADDDEYQGRAAKAVGGFDLRNIGVGGSTTGPQDGSNVNSLFGRAAYLDAYPEKIGTTRAKSILLVSEGTNEPGAAGFANFQAYVMARVAAGWGQIIIGTPAASGPGTQIASITEFYNLVKSTTWPENVRVVDMRQGAIATYDPAYYADVLHWHKDGHAVADTLLQPVLLAAKIALTTAKKGALSKNLYSDLINKKLSTVNGFIPMNDLPDQKLVEKNMVLKVISALDGTCIQDGDTFNFYLPGDFLPSFAMVGSPSGGPYTSLSGIGTVMDDAATTLLLPIVNRLYALPGNRMRLRDAVRATDMPQLMAYQSIIGVLGGKCLRQGDTFYFYRPGAQQPDFVMVGTPSGGPYTKLERI